MRLFYPASCGVCETVLDVEEKNLCLPCSAKLETLRLAPEKRGLRQKFEHLDEAWALYPYASPVSDILTALKFLKKRWLARIFKETLAETAAMAGAETNYDFILPVPLDNQRLIEREFNQSGIFAELLEKTLSCRARARLLVKRWPTPAQSSLGQTERHVNLFGAFALPRPKWMVEKNVLLVDDIVTTGATADEIARILKEAGAKRVDLIAIARTEENS